MSIVPRKPYPVPQRVERWFATKIRPSEDCWEWVGAKTRNGYGQTTFRGSHWMAHRAIYTYFVADIPTGLDLDHLCRNRACVNPWHMEPVTRSVNLMRGTTKRTHMSSRTHCPQGHAYDEANTAIRNGRRTCRACDRARAQRNRNRKALANGKD